MSALIQARMTRERKVKQLLMTLAANETAFKGGLACIDLTTGTLRAGKAGISLVPVGNFAESPAAVNASQLVNVDFPEEITLRYYDNDAGAPVIAADIGQPCWILDDHTVTLTQAGNSVAGIVMQVDSLMGVGVRLLAPPLSDDGPSGLLALAPALAFAANAIALTTAQAVSGAEFDVPVTAGVSTISLPAGALDGTILYFSADGTKNGHTVQYLDATGATALTTALLASKRHLAVAVKRGGKWFVNAYVSP